MSDFPAEIEVEMTLPGGGRALLVGDAADASVMASIANNDGAYGPDLMSLLPRLVEPEAVCVDVGAKVGPITLALSVLCPEGHVHAFEPAGESFGFLERNLDVHGVTNVTAHRLALSDSCGEVTLSYNGGFAGGAFISDRLADGIQERVAETTLDSWASSIALSRLDLIKVDVEGYEEKVLEGAHATVRRFRPTLIVELNPVTLQRMQGRNPGDLFRRLRRLYGAVGHVALISPEGRLVPVFTWAQVRRQLAELAIVNLVCSPGRIIPGSHRAAMGPGAAAATLLRSARRHSRFSTPAWAVSVVDPRVRIMAREPDRPLRGPPGARIAVSLAIRNLSAVAIVGDGERFPVSMRVIWIDEEGHHTVDDRSRVLAPTVRPRASANVNLSLVLPVQPGRHVARVALFQEGLAWFHDLDETSFLDLSVLVTE